VRPHKQTFGRDLEPPHQGQQKWRFRYDGDVYLSEARAVADSRPNEPPPQFEEVYTQLLAIARQRLASERRDHTLQATALVHEVWLKIQGERPVEWGGRAQFFAAAAEAMRRVLIDHARARQTEKRGGGRRVLSITGVADLAEDYDPDGFLALDDAIVRLEGVDRQAAAVVRLRFYAGLSEADVSEALGLSVRTVRREWAIARGWLRNALERAGS
jgi:RNA polymerase sigma factor (TIGR02999 family)